MSALELSWTGCGVSATTRIEARPDENGATLDAVLYACREHSGVAIDAVRDWGRAACPMAVQVPDSACCGETDVRS